MDLLGTLLLFSLPAAADPNAADAAALEHFEKHVRPVLAENCFACHGPQKQRAGLRLDSRAALLKGGDGGKVVVPGQPDASPLLRAVRQVGELKMPPKGKLPEPAIAALAEWVR